MVCANPRGRLQRWLCQLHKKVQVRGVLVDFSAKSINAYYHLKPVNAEPYDRIYANLNYHEILRLLTNGQGEWKLNNEGHVVHFKAKHLAYILKVWHHFITFHLILTTNVCEVTEKRALLNHAIIQDIPFDIGHVIEDATLYNRYAKMNLEHPFLIYGLCKKAGVLLEDNEAWIHHIKAIVIKKDKSGVPRFEAVFDSGNEPLNEEELTTYKNLFGMREKTPGEANQPSTIHPLHHYPRSRMSPVFLFP